MKNCIYKITNSINEKVYIGSTKNFQERKRSHIKLLENNRHHSIYFQNFYNHYKPSIFFEIIEVVDNELDLWEREFYWINYYKSYIPIYGFNCSLNPRNSKGLNPIAQYSLDGKFLQVFHNIELARTWMKQNNYKWSHCPYNYKFVGGFQWKMVNLENIPKEIESIVTYYGKYDIEGNLISFYDNLSNAVKNTSIIKSNLLRAITNQTKCNEFYWKSFINSKIEDIDKKIIIKLPAHKTKKIGIFKNDILVKEFISVTEVSNYFKCPINSISRVLKGKYCKTYQDYKIKYMGS